MATSRRTIYVGRVERLGIADAYAAFGDQFQADVWAAEQVNSLRSWFIAHEALRAAKNGGPLRGPGLPEATPYNWELAVEQLVELEAVYVSVHTVELID